MSPLGATAVSVGTNDSALSYSPDSRGASSVHTTLPSVVALYTWCLAVSVMSRNSSRPSPASVRPCAPGKSWPQLVSSLPLGSYTSTLLCVSLVSSRRRPRRSCTISWQSFTGYLPLSSTPQPFTCL